MMMDKSSSEKPSTVFYRYLTFTASGVFILVPVLLAVGSIRAGDWFGLALAAGFTLIAIVYTWRRPVAQFVSLDEEKHLLTLRTMLRTVIIPCGEIISVRRVSLSTPGGASRVQVVTRHGRGLTRLSYILVSDAQNRVLERLRASTGCLNGREISDS